MLSKMIHQIENVNAFQAVENALLYGVDQKTTLQYVFEISQGKRKDFIEILQQQAREKGVEEQSFSRRGKRGRSREKANKIKESIKNLYQDMSLAKDSGWRKLREEHLKQNLYVNNLSPAKIRRNFGNKIPKKDEKLDQFVSIVERGELSSTFVRMRKDLEDQALKLKYLDYNEEFQGTDLYQKFMFS